MEETILQNSVLKEGRYCIKVNLKEIEYDIECIHLPQERVQ